MAALKKGARRSGLPEPYDKIRATTLWREDEMRAYAAQRASEKARSAEEAAERARQAERDALAA
jgi:hypothetical protein